MIHLLFHPLSPKRLSSLAQVEEKSDAALPDHLAFPGALFQVLGFVDRFDGDKSLHRGVEPLPISSSNFRYFCPRLSSGSLIASSTAATYCWHQTWPCRPERTQLCLCLHAGVSDTVDVLGPYWYYRLVDCDGDGCGSLLD